MQVNAATLTHTALAAQADHKVDTTAPTVSSVAITSTANSSNTYAAGEKVKATVTFNESMNVTGTPQLTLKIGASEKTASYTTTGSTTTKLVFEYTIASGDTDTDGISIEADKLQNNSGSTIKDTAGNAATLTHTVLAAQADHKVDTTGPTVSSIAITSTANSSNTYAAGEKVQATVTFDENVSVTDTPQLTLKIGTADKKADYESGTGTTAIVFAYTVAAGDADTDGISIAANSLALNNGTIKDNVANAATLTHTAVGTQASHKVDGVAPTVVANGISITSTPDVGDSYKADEKVQATMTFSESVTVTGTPQLTLKIGNENKGADYKSGTGSTKLVFEYTVVSGDEDTDGIGIEADKLTLPDGTISITDAVGNDATLTHKALLTQPNHKVDAIVPTVRSLSFTSSAGADEVYTAGDKVQATLTFSENVTVTGTPQLTLTIGATAKTADYMRGTGSTELVFEYTVVAGDEDTDGISIAADQLALNSGTIKDRVSNDATLTHAAVTAQAAHKVSAIAPTVRSLSITSSSGNNYYKQGAKLQVTVTFSKNVTVTGTPTVAIKIGTASKNASWTSGSGTTALVFEYTIAADDEDTDGISIAANQLALNSGTIKDTDNNAATLDHEALPTQSGHKVDGVVPTVATNGIEITSTSAPYGVDEKIQATLTFSEKVTVTGTPQLTLKIGEADKEADWTRGTGTKKLVFEYTVASGDADTDGISIEKNSLALNSGTIKDTAGNAATLTHTALSTQPNHKVDTTPGESPGQVTPTISSLALTSTGPYRTGGSIEVTVSTNENITVTGTPTLTLVVGTTDRTANYNRGSGSTALVFRYTVVADETDTDGVAVKINSLALNGGTLKDSDDNALPLTHSAIANAGSSHVVDTTAPAVTANGLAITSTSGNNYYTQGAKLTATVTFNEDVIVTGAPTLTLTIGSSSENASYKSGSDSKELVFEYTIAADDEDTDGVSIAANQLSFNGGTIKDAAGNAATLTHSALGTQAEHKIDGIVPAVAATNGLAITSTGAPYSVDEKVQTTMTFSESVTVTGTPQLTLKIGSGEKKANYTSGSGTTKLVFEYTVAAGDADTDGISIEADKLALNSGTIKDVAGNAATLTHAALTAQASHKVDTTKPTIPTSDGITIISTPTNNYYQVNDKIQATVTFSKKVKVTGTPQLTLKIDSGDKTANYTSGSGTKKLVFEYTVASDDADADGIEIEADKLALNSGTIKDLAGNDATLTHTALTTNYKIERTSKNVDGTAPIVSSVEITSKPSTNGTYKTGETIKATVTFDESVVVTGTPQLTLKIGSADKIAAYTSGSGSTKLVFGYTVISGDVDTDGISIEANKLANNAGSTIKDTAGNAADLAHEAVPAQAQGVSGQGALATEGALGMQVVSGQATQNPHKVDGIAPSISKIAITSTATTNFYYKEGNTIAATVTFSENVYVTGSPLLQLTVGSDTNTTAAYERGTGSKALIFEYTVAAGDVDTDGISIGQDALSGTIKDHAGNIADLTSTSLSTQPAHKVDTIAPTINGIAITSTPGSNQTYGVGEKIQARVTFSESVKVTGTPTLTLKIGTAYKNAAYTAGTDTVSLVFEYTVAEGDADTDGISIDSHQLSGTITDVASNPGDLTNTTLTTQSAHKVDAVPNTPITDTVPPTISSLAITSTAGSNNTYTFGEAIQITVAFSESVKVTGTPVLTLKIGTAYKDASYTNGSGTSKLVFEYTVATGDADTDGISIDSHQLSGTITDAAGNPGDLTNTTLTTQSTHKVDAAPNTPTTDTVPPTISSLAITSTAGSNNTYIFGETVQITVAFSETVKVTGTPTLMLKIGTAYKDASYTNGSGTSKLLFEYTVATGDVDTDGISIDSHQLSGTITDVAGNPGDLTNTTLTTQPTHKVDAAPNTPPTDIVPPTISSLAISSTGPYGVWETIEVTVTTTTPVMVTGGATLTIVIGSSEKRASYQSGTGTNTLVFGYTVASGDGDDPNGITVKANSLSVNGGTIRDALDTDLELSHDALRDTGSQHAVDTTAPKVSAIAFSSTGPYGIGSTIQVTLTTSEAVTVAGRPTLTFLIGSTERLAHYYNGTGTTSLSFSYQVSTADQDDPNGVSVKANSLALNDGTMTDSVGNAFILSHNSVANGGDTQSVGTTISSVKSVAFTSTGPYSVDDVIKVEVATSEKVTVTGTPRIALTIGSTTRYADYASGSKTTTLAFQYTVVAGDTDSDGVEIPENALENNSSMVINEHRTPLHLRHASVAADTKHAVDTTAPEVQAVAFDPNAPTVYTAGSTLEVIVTFEEAGVQLVPGTNGDVPSLTLRFGENSARDSQKTAVKAAYKETRAGGTQFVFTYAITSETPADIDGVQIESRSLRLPAGAAITDIGGNAIKTTPDEDGGSIVAIRPSSRSEQRPGFTDCRGKQCRLQRVPKRENR